MQALADQKNSALLYADDTVLLCSIPVGLRRALGEFSCSFDLNQLVVNYPKTKVMSFGVRPKIRLWSINNHNLEQIFQLQISGGCGGPFKKIPVAEKSSCGKDKSETSEQTHNCYFYQEIPQKIL